MRTDKIEIYDTTLRDGAQQPGISLSLHDKLVLMRRLDDIGVHYIELGWPGSNEKDTLVFEAAKKNLLKKAKIVAFGMTCSKGKKPEDDGQLAKLLAAETEVIAIVGKTSKRQVENVLGVTPRENLRLIEESCRFLAEHRRIVFFDAEHFFDGYKLDKIYALDCLRAAVSGGVSRVVLCDTNGGSLPSEIAHIISAVRKKIAIPVGIHTHNDGEMAVANSLAAVEAGADHVQVTINGYGERCGNANLCSVVPALTVKMGMQCISNESVAQLTDLARFTAELVNLPLNHRQPYVGKKAFCHKAGLHVNANSKDPGSYNHIDPEAVGNTSSTVVSELSGKSNVVMKAKEFGISLTQRQVKKVLAQVENLENRGFQFEGADGSLELAMLKAKRGYSRPFDIFYSNVDSERFGKKKPRDLAIVKVRINNERRETVHHVANGNGPVNAMDNVLRKALLPHFPTLEKVRLVDFKVRTVRGERGTGSFVRVIINFSNGEKDWDIVYCSTDLIEASSQALAEGLEYAIAKAL